MTTILMPLVFTSLDRIDVITNAMELRGFGKGKKKNMVQNKKTKKCRLYHDCCLNFGNNDINLTLCD